MDTALQRLGSILFLAIALFCTTAYAEQKSLLIVGDSLSAAYGIPTETSWVAKLKDRLSEKGYEQWKVINASIGGETTDGGLRRMPDLLESHTPDLVVIELGGNDGLRGFPPRIIRKNISQMIELSQEVSDSVLLVGMQIPPNYGQKYTEAFAAIYPQLSDKYDTALVPFFLKDVFDQDGMMQGDSIHPTAEAQGQLLDNLWPHLEPLLSR